ncbi:MAG TPA: YfiR family protein [Candidatus Limnocylindrales bacterium]|nr:YfiR family protein [Candidatus Limnocylindrales bacterium]
MATFRNSIRSGSCRLAAWALSVSVVVAAAAPALAQGIDAQKAAKLKAAYLLNFVKYAQWPEECFDSPTSPIVITLAGQCDVTDVLAEVVSATEPVGGRAVTLRRAAVPGDGASEEQWASVYESMKPAHLLYICGLPAPRVQAILRGVADGDVLTVSDIPMFAASGGMLGFVLRGNRIIFEANLDAIQRSRIAVSAKVLQLAQIVGPRSSP